MPTINERLHERAGLIKQARDILDRAEQEKRTPNAEERASAQKALKDAQAIRTELADDLSWREELEAEERDLRAINPRRSEAPPAGPGDEDHDERRPSRRASLPHQMRGVRRDTLAETPLEKRVSGKPYNAAFRQFCAAGKEGLLPDHVREFAEVRALSAGSDPQAGYLIAPLQMLDGLIQAVDDLLWIRQLATVTQVTAAESLGLTSLDADPADADWTSEIATGSEDSTMAFGKRELSPYPLAKRIKVSNKLLRLTGGGAETLVRDRLGYKFAVTEEKAFLTGSGAKQPLGVFVASSDGIPTSRDMATGNSTTAIAADNLIRCKMTLKPQYRMRPSTRWLFHTDALLQVMLLKDTTNQYLWSPGLTAEAPDRLLNIPTAESQFAPNTFTTGLYVGILGDWSYYHIAEALRLEVRRLDELYAETNQTGFIGRLELDGQPVLGEAFVRVKLG